MYCFRDKLATFLWVTPKAQIINMQMMCQDKTQIKLFSPTLKEFELEVANFQIMAQCCKRILTCGRLSNSRIGRTRVCFLTFQWQIISENSLAHFLFPLPLACWVIFAFFPATYLLSARKLLINVFRGTSSIIHIKQRLCQGPFPEASAFCSWAPPLPCLPAATAWDSALQDVSRPLNAISSKKSHQKISPEIKTLLEITGTFPAG